MAGCMFTDGHIVLAGFQPKISKMSGFGGKSLENETPFETAIRETLEELLGVRNVPYELIAKMPPCERHIAYPAYTCFVYNFDDLETILRRARRYYITSDYYSKFPTEVGELILQRQSVEGMEVEELFLIPASTRIAVSRSFQKDISAVEDSFGSPH